MAHYDEPSICATYFFPRPDVPLPRGPRAAPVDLGGGVGGYWARPLDGAPTLLYLHGNGECVADQLGHWPQWARDAGANVFFVDYPGYASSHAAGPPTFSGCAGAALAALDYLAARPASEVASVIVCGRSAGSIFAGSAARARLGGGRVAGLMLESAIADMMERLDMRIDWPASGLDRAAVAADVTRDFDQRATLETFDRPVLVLHTRADMLVTVDNAERLAAWAGDALHEQLVFERGDHNSIQVFNEADYRGALRRFVAAAAG